MNFHAGWHRTVRGIVAPAANHSVSPCLRGRRSRSPAAKSSEDWPCPWVRSSCWARRSQAPVLVSSSGATTAMGISPSGARPTAAGSRPRSLRAWHHRGDAIFRTARRPQAFYRATTRRTRQCAATRCYRSNATSDILALNQAARSPGPGSCRWRRLRPVAATSSVRGSRRMRLRHRHRTLITHGELEPTGRYISPSWAAPRRLVAVLASPSPHEHTIPPSSTNSGSPYNPLHTASPGRLVSQRRHQALARGKGAISRASVL